MKKTRCMYSFRLSLAFVLAYSFGSVVFAQVFTTPAPVYTDSYQVPSINYMMAKSGANATTSVAWTRYSPPNGVHNGVVDLMLSQSTAGGAFSPAEVVAINSGIYDMHVTPGGKIHIADVENPSRTGGQDVLKYRSRSSAGTFLAPVQIAGPGNLGWPRLVADDRGAVFVVWSGSAGSTPWCLAYSRSSDGGVSFSAPTCIGESSAPHDIAIDGDGRLHVFYATYAGTIGEPPQPAYNLHYRRSDPSQADGFGAPVTVAANVSNTRNWDLEVAPNGAVGVAYSLGSTTATLHYAYSTDGLSFTTRTVSAGAAQTPDLVFDAQNGAHLAWEPLDMGGNVFYSYAADGQVFTAPVQLSQVSVNTQQAYGPRIVVDSRGYQNVSWGVWDDAILSGAVYLSRSSDHVNFTTQHVSAAPSANAYTAETAVDGEGRITVAWTEELLTDRTVSYYRPLDVDVWYSQAASSVPGNVPPGTPIPPQAGPPAEPGPPTSPGPPAGAGRPPR